MFEYDAIDNRERGKRFIFRMTMACVAVVMFVLMQYKYVGVAHAIVFLIWIAMFEALRRRHILGIYTASVFGLTLLGIIFSAVMAYGALQNAQNIENLGFYALSAWIWIILCAIWYFTGKK